MSDVIWGNVPPKNKKGREQAFSSQTRIILKLTCLGRGWSDFDEIWHDDAELCKYNFAARSFTRNFVTDFF